MRHRFHALCPYFAMFPEEFAGRWIARLSAPGDLVLDPFCGRGTAPFQAVLDGRRAIATDINPVAYCVTRAKAQSPPVSRLKQRCSQLRSEYRWKQWESLAAALPEFFHFAFSSNTLRQLVYLRSRLRWRESRVDCMLSAVVLGILHGESHRSLRYLSNRMPRTISTKPAYSIRYWKNRGCVAPARNVFDCVGREIEYRYASGRPEGSALVLNQDFRNLPRTLGPTVGKPKLTITSPPYLNVTSFEEDQWLRLWFLGNPPHPTYRVISRDDRHESRSAYWALISDLWRVLGQVMDNDSHVVLRLGGKGLNDAAIIDGLRATSVFSGREVRLIGSECSDVKGGQRRSFHPGGAGCSREIDCVFRMA